MTLEDPVGHQEKLLLEVSAVLRQVLRGVGCPYPEIKPSMV